MEIDCNKLDDIISSLKAIVHSIAESSGISDEALEEIETELVNISTQGVCVLDKPGRKKGKRKPSAYNNFIGQCMRPHDKGGDGKPMKVCATQWRSKSDADKKKYVKVDEA